MTKYIKQRASKVQINLEVAERFLNALAPNAKNFTFQTFDDSDRKRKNLACVLHGTLAEHADELSHLNKRGACVAVTINATEGPGRTTEDVIGVRAVFVDLDGADLEPVRQFKPRPHIIVESSRGKFHAYWRVKGLERDQFEGVQRASAERFGGDDVHDLPRSMRLPGFLHTLAEHADELSHLNKRGACVAVTINATEGPGRTTEDVIGVRAVFVDLDGADLEPVRQFKPRPHIIVESSRGKFHAYWRVKGLERDQFEGVQRASAERFGGDDVHDLPRSMRLPGFLHRKGEPYRVRIIKVRDKPPHSASRILKAFPPVKKPKSKPVTVEGKPIREGARNARLISLGGTMIRMGASPETIHAALFAENQTFDPPMADKEVEGIIRSTETYRGTDEEDQFDLCAKIDPIDHGPCNI